MSRTARVIVASTRAASGTYTDDCGPIIAEWLEQHGFLPVQPVVVAPLTAPDGSGGQSYNADDVVVSPTTTTGTGTGSSTGGGSNISDFENLRGLFG